MMKSTLYYFHLFNFGEFCWTQLKHILGSFLCGLLFFPYWVHSIAMVMLYYITSIAFSSFTIIPISLPLLFFIHSYFTFVLVLRFHPFYALAIFEFLSCAGSYPLNPHFEFPEYISALKISLFLLFSFRYKLILSFSLVILVYVYQASILSIWIKYSSPSL